MNATALPSDAGNLTTGASLMRWYMALVGLLLLSIALATVVSHVSQAMAGTTLVVSQAEMNSAGGGIGPAPSPGESDPVTPDEAGGSTQYVDLPSIGRTLAGGILAIAGVIMLGRRSRWSLPLALVGAGVVVIVGLFPASLGIWAMGYYGGGSVGSVVPYLAVSAVLSGAAVAGAWAIWRNRARLAES